MRIETNEKNVIKIYKDNKLLKIFINDDFYFDIFGGGFEIIENEVTSSFEIEESDEIFPYFKQLIKIIKEAQVFVPSEIEMELIDDAFEFYELAESYKEDNARLKDSNQYNKLVKGDIIEIYSDSIYDERANRMTIKETDGKIRLDFFDNPDDYVDGFGVRISHDGSKYSPFDLCFSRFFQKMYSDLKQENKEKKIGKIENK